MPYEKFEAWKVTHELALEVYGSLNGGLSASDMS